MEDDFATNEMVSVSEEHDKEDETEGSVNFYLIMQAKLGVELKLLVTILTRIFVEHFNDCALRRNKARRCCIDSHMKLAATSASNCNNLIKSMQCPIMYIVMCYYQVMNQMIWYANEVMTLGFIWLNSVKE